MRPGHHVQGDRASPQDYVPQRRNGLSFVNTSGFGEVHDYFDAIGELGYLELPIVREEAVRGHLGKADGVVDRFQELICLDDAVSLIQVLLLPLQYE